MKNLTNFQRNKIYNHCLLNGLPDLLAALIAKRAAPPFSIDYSISGECAMISCFFTWLYSDDGIEFWSDMHKSFSDNT
jgi:hypothetical protein